MSGVATRTTPTQAVEARRSSASTPTAVTASGSTGRLRADALAAAAQVERADRGRATSLPLAGTTLAVKDNIDVAGLRTTAGCPAFAYVPHVTRAGRAGASWRPARWSMGKTNLDQFATGLVGTRSPYGICPNAHWPGLVAGGSSAGSAVAVAAGLVDLALGTDTAGSGRVPAACNGIVGLKPTRGRISTAGVVPACHSLDCVSVFARDVTTAAAAVAVAARASPDPADPWSRAAPAPVNGARLSPVRIGVPDAAALDFDGDPTGAGALRRRRSSDWRRLDVELVPFDLEPFLACGRLLYGGFLRGRALRRRGRVRRCPPRTRSTRWWARSSAPPARCRRGRCSATRPSYAAGRS